MLREFLDWLDDRAGVRDLLHHALDEPLPKKVGWAHVLGSGAMFLFIVQVVTGIFLAMNYNPSPDHAYWSIQYIMNEVTMGRVVRGLHHWGASLMFIVVVLHMLRAYVYGAYKPPRELTWIVGVLLLMIVIGFSFTGYLLPWDQKAYWATQVGTEIPATVPLAGPAIKKIMRGGEELGARTLARFFAVHALLLPALIVPLIAAHLYLMRRKGETPPFTDEPEEKVEKPITFYPFQMFKDTLFAGVLLAILLFLTFKFGVHLEGIADPTPGSYHPRPEWYFLPIFQMLKLKIGSFALFGGPREWIGAVLVPSIALLLLLLLPFLDRNPSRLPRKRLGAMAAAFAVLTIATLLGVIAHAQTPKQPEPEMLTQEAFLGKRVFQEKQCFACHDLTGKRPALGPSFVKGRNGRSKEWLIAFFKDPSSVYGSANKMPPVTATIEDLEFLAEYVLTFRAEWHRAQMPEVQAGADNRAQGSGFGVRPPQPPLAKGGSRGGEKPAALQKGEEIFMTKCAACHKIDDKGVGIPAAPAFIKGKNERSREWLMQYIPNPASQKPGAIMPPQSLSQEELEAAVEYLMGFRVKS